MLAPKRVKYRKQHRPRPLKGLATGGTEIFVGDYGLKATTPGWITARQIESARIAITRAVKRGGKVRIAIFPDRSITRKPLETRMGSGKGSPDLGRGRQARPGPVRDLGRPRGARTRGHAPRVAQAPRQDQVRRA